MGYNKAVIYGNQLDLYNYERDITPRGSKSPVRKPDLVNARSSKERQEYWQGRRRDNKNRTTMAFRRLILSNLTEHAPPLLITCTYAENQQDLEAGYKDFHAFIRNLRYRHGKEFRYICVPEFQKRGAIHFHSLFWGLPENLSSEERHTRLVASYWGKGFVDVFLTDGDNKLSTYLAKYMSKAHTDLRLIGQKAFRCSRNIKRPVTEKNVMMVFLQHQYGVDGDNTPLREVNYNTQWLGKGRYRLYQINPL